LDSLLKIYIFDNSLPVLESSSFYLNALFAFFNIKKMAWVSYLNHIEVGFIKKIILSFLLIIACSIQTISQNWSVTTVIYDQGVNVRPKFAVDHLGVIHCVWSHKIELNYRPIYYSKSSDGGATWSNPEDIWPAADCWLDEPQIECDTLGHVYVSYSHDCGNTYETMIHMQVFDGKTWSEPVSLSDSLPGSYFSRLVIDRSSRIYCFWFWGGSNGGSIYYKVLEHGEWSPVKMLFTGYPESYILLDAACDNQNRFHCLAGHHTVAQGTGNEDVAVYFTFKNGICDNYTILNSRGILRASCLELDPYCTPSVIFAQEGEGDTPGLYDAYYRELHNGTWTEPEFVTRDLRFMSYTIASNGGQYAIFSEMQDSMYLLEFYQKKADGWIGTTIDSNRKTYFWESNLVACGNTIHNVTEKGMQSGLAMVLYSSFLIPLGKDEVGIPAYINLYPNPVNENTQFNFTVQSTQNVMFTVLNMKGKALIKKSGLRCAGQCTISFKDLGIDIHKMDSGEYILVMETEDFNSLISIKFLVM
jgi:hypothetical protein